MKKKKKKSTHRYQTYKAKEVLVYSVMNSVDRCPVLLILFSRTQTMETLLDFHTFGSLRKISAEKKIIRVDRVTILRGFLLTLIEIITKSVCETLFSSLAFDLELLVYQLPLTKSSIFTKSNSSLYFYLQGIKYTMQGTINNSQLVYINKSYLSFEKTWLPLSHKYLTC